MTKLQLTMKKKVLGIALLAAAFAGLNASAQDNKTCNNNCSAATCTQTCDNNCPTPGNCNEANKKGMRPANQPNPFEGLNLSDAQKEQLKALRDKNAQARKDANKDKAQRNADKRNERLAQKKQYLEEVKAIIGNDNYVVFLENFYLNAGARPGQPKMGQNGKIAYKNMSPNRNRNKGFSRDTNAAPKTQKSYQTEQAPSK